jgi:serine protease Do
VINVGFQLLARRAAIVAATVALGLSAAQPALARDTPASFADLVDQLIPTVVNIATTTQMPQAGSRLRDMPQLPPGSPFEELFKEFFDKRGGEEQRRKGTSLGSGFIIDGEGYIVTNNHVIQGAEDITVILRDDTQLKAKLVGSDSRIDVAVLKVEPPNKKPLPAVKWGDSDKMRVGDWVIAIGNPFGLGHSVTAGIISARGRSLNQDALDDYLQTDAAINKGNSGGPLFDAQGEVIGVNTAIYSPSGTNAGLAFSIPSNQIKQAADQIREFGRVKRGWIGVSYQTVTDDIADSFSLDRARGVLVANVVADGPAAKAGLKRNDIIISFGGQEVPDLRRFPRFVANARVGSTLDIVVWRQGKETPLKIRIGEQEEPEKQNVAAQGSKKPVEPDQPVASNIEQLGLTLQKATDQLRERYGLSDQVKGVVVTQVAPNSSAAEKQLQPGDVILEVDQKAVTSPAEVIEIVGKLQQQKKRSVLLFVERQGDPRFAALRLTK